MNDQHDLAIRWNDRAGEMGRVRRKGGVEVYGCPHHLKVPGGKVLLVTQGGRVRLAFSVAHIEGPQVVRLPDGKQRQGYIIKAKQGSFRSPGGDLHRLRIRWHAIGQYRYVDARKAKALLVEPARRTDSAYLEDDTPVDGHLVFHSFRGTIPGHPLNHPEAKLVRQYLAWLGDADGFGQNYIREAGLFVDLFDRRKWRLIEAKASAQRERVRMAVGQLMDYRRFYKKSPSLGVLLPEKPTVACLSFLRENRIVAVWRTATGRFNDSTKMHSWTQLRRRRMPSTR